MVHVTLLFLTAAQVLMLIKPESAYQSQVSYLVNDLFMTTDPGLGSYSPDTENGSNPSAEPLTIYNIPALVQFINRTRDNYFFSLEEDDMLSKMYPGKNETTGEVEPIKVFTFASNNKILDTLYLTNSSLGPFENSTADLKKQLYDVQIMSLNFNLHQYINPYAGAEGTCYIE